jgi:hypothetical protein
MAQEGNNNSILGSLRMMTVDDPKLKTHVDRVVSLLSSLPEELRPVAGLLDACYFYDLVEGPESTQAREALRLLLSPRLRPALRQWYQMQGNDMNPAALDFRQRLSVLARETFG